MRTAVELGGRNIRQDEAIIEAAWCYFHNSMNQSDIAKRLGVSRASVVNYLAEARRRGYVRVSLDPNIFRETALADGLKSKFGLRDVLVVPSDADDGAGSLERTVRAASDWLPDLLETGDRLGVAWGETIYRLAEAAPTLSLEDLTIVQLLGSRPAAMGFAAETCSGTLARKFGARVVNLHVPLMVSSPDLAQTLCAEPVVAEQLRAIEDCNKVIFASGTCFEDSHVVQSGLVDAKDLPELHARGAVGVICGRLIDERGAPLQLEGEDCMIGVTLDQMRNKDMGVLVASGIERAVAAKAALLGGYATHFATCSKTARYLLEITS
ncbi:MAG: sugar-binding transcriptional regulator [Aliishimia sp.]